MKDKIDVVWPLGKVSQPPQALAPRLDSLEGKTVCGVFNGVFHFQETWPVVKQALSRRYPGVKFAGWEEFGLFDGNEEISGLEALPEKLARYGCDAVVSGRGC